ncbi:ABC transporter ATP-binding protein [Roseivirga pacifica]|uniref:ABC transporter ATP-binding protein n=1 Tax=Roseivirga pacifica TaxID=1267423 RepID=UPI003BADB65D
MKIEASGLGKKFIREWIFRKLDASFETGIPTAITGPNGSGKSTLIQLLSGFKLPTEGEVTFSKNGKAIPVEEIFSYMDIATPYMELIEEFTLKEFLDFHFKFKQLKAGFSLQTFLEKVYLADNQNKQIKHFSSGMKQRLKLGLAFFSTSDICFLDEPTSNLDQKGTDWYLENVQACIDSKVLIICSNQPHEYDFCPNKLYIPDFKQ